MSLTPAIVSLRRFFFQYMVQIHDGFGREPCYWVVVSNMFSFLITITVEDSHFDYTLVN